MNKEVNMASKDNERHDEPSSGHYAVQYMSKDIEIQQTTPHGDVESRTSGWNYFNITKAFESTNQSLKNSVDRGENLEALLDKTADTVEVSISFAQDAAALREHTSRSGSYAPYLSSLIISAVGICLYFGSQEFLPWGLVLFFLGLALMAVSVLRGVRQSAEARRIHLEDGLAQLEDNRRAQM